MILIENLTKKYKSKNRRVCVALDRVNLVLPDTGMIFIIGKSGSGKSTLLNMLGGLDSFDGGSIVADGNDLSKFSGRSFYKYRASYVGFIFQDYHLIEELTVEENVRLEAEIANAKGFDVSCALAEVDLEGYGERFPEELSGGQKQRVAIARALIKSPRVVLCDEPTGNLDKNTSRQIMELLHSISRERLVVIVSHNMPDAEKYADRIIELSDGRVISDLERRSGYKNELTLEDEILTVPYNHNLTAEETDSISKAIKDGRVKRLVQNDGGYQKTDGVAFRPERIKLRDSKMKRASIMKLFSAFSRVGKLRTATTAFISAVMVVLLIIIQSFLMFDGSRAIAQALGDDSGGTISLKKNLRIDDYGNTDSSQIYKITDDDISALDGLCGENTRKYLLYNLCVPVDMNSTSECNKLDTQFNPTLTFGINHIYTTTMFGTLACDEEYLLRKFGKGGELTVLAGDPYQSLTDGSVIITDYIADAMMVHSPQRYRSYEDVLGPLYEGNKYIWVNISAVIDTGYKEKYKGIIEAIAENENAQEMGVDTLDKEVALDFIDDVQSNLAVAYSINPNFISAMSESCMFKNYSEVPGTVSIGGEEYNPHYIWIVTKDFHNIELNDGEVLLSQSLFSQMFPDISKDEFTFPVEMTIEWTEWHNGEGEKIIDKTYTVIGFSPAHQMVMSENDLAEIKSLEVIPYAVYLENYEDINEAIDVMAERGFSLGSTEGNAVTLLNKSVNMFFDLFRLIEIMMLVMTVVFLVSHSIRSVKNNYYQIGVIKAIGGRSSDISKIFVLQNILLSAVISALTYVGALIFVDIANDILIKSFTEITGAGVGNINIISFDPPLVILSMLATMALGLLSTVVPLLLLHNIRPINIIKAKE